jgi:hypothetical protein
LGDKKTSYSGEALVVFVLYRMVSWGWNHLPRGVQKEPEKIIPHRIFHSSHSTCWEFKKLLVGDVKNNFLSSMLT